MSAEDPLRDPAPEFPEYCDVAGAMKLKEKIESYWSERGHTVFVKIEKKGYVGTMRGARFDIRSDLFNGMPLPPAISRQEAA